MAAGAEMSAEAVPAVPSTKNSDPKSEFGAGMQSMIVDMLSNLKLNPLAKEFFPSSYSHDHLTPDFSKNSPNDAYPNNRRVIFLFPFDFLFFLISFIYLSRQMCFGLYLLYIPLLWAIQPWKKKGGFGICCYRICVPSWGLIRYCGFIMLPNCEFSVSNWIFEIVYLVNSCLAVIFIMF